ncbi:MAG TPA: SHOCT domain-containing protein [Candidatus Limnocylindria bacterium]
MTFHWGDGWIWVVSLLPILFWIGVLLLGVIVVVRLINRDRAGMPGYGSDSAEEILRRRFAAGEIDADEYERRLEILRRR